MRNLHRLLTLLKPYGLWFAGLVLGRRMQERTSILIAHRLSTVKNADGSLVLHEFRILESGRHQDFVRCDVLYHRLYKHRFEAVL